MSTEKTPTPETVFDATLGTESDAGDMAQAQEFMTQAHSTGRMYADAIARSNNGLTQSLAGTSYGVSTVLQPPEKQRLKRQARLQSILNPR